MYFISWNYVWLGFMFMFSVSIGLYYCVVPPPQTTRLQYFLGRRNIPSVPVAISIFMSSQSGLNIFSVVRDIYIYDSMIMYSYIAYGLAHLIQCTVVVPLLWPFGLISVNEVGMCKRSVSHFTVIYIVVNT